MCGRYYFYKENHQFVKTFVDEDESEFEETSGDQNPGKIIPVLIARNHQIIYTSMKWGYSMKTTHTLVINARCESLLEKKMFSEDIKKHRCLIPISGFYERDSRKNELSFESKQRETLFLAGIYREQEKEVTIITTKANQTMKGIHPRMPLIIPIKEIKNWLFDNQSLERLLSSTPEELDIVSGHLQQSLFDD